MLCIFIIRETRHRESNRFIFFFLLQVSTSVLLIPSTNASVGRAKSSVAGEFHYYQHDALPLITMIDKQSQRGNDVHDIVSSVIRPELLLKSTTRRYIVPWRIEFSCEIKRRCCCKTDKASTVPRATASAICSLSSDKLFREQSFTFRISEF